MAITSCIATQGSDNSINIMASGSNGNVKNHADGKEPKRVLLALDGSLFSRRFHLKPFENRGKLEHILPSLLEDSLFENDLNEEGFKSVFTTSSLEKNKFTSFTINRELLDKTLNDASKQISPIIAVAPLPFGLKYFVPSGQDAIVIAPNNQGKIMAVAVKNSGEVADFRCLTPEKWETEGYLTLRTWLEFIPDAKIYYTGEFSQKNMPESIKKKLISIELPAFTQPDEAASYGLLQMSAKAWNSDEKIRVTDPKTWNNINNLCKKTLPVLAIATLATLFAGVGVWYENYQLGNQEKAIKNATNTIFSEALPATPMLDAPLQMTRRVNELALLSGSGLINASPITQIMLDIQNKVKEQGINMTLNEFRLNNNSLSINGQLPTLSDVDSLQAIIGEIMGDNYKTELNNANMGDSGQVNFQIESRK